MFTKNSLLITSLICLSMSAKSLIASDSCKINKGESVSLSDGTTTIDSSTIYQISTFNFNDNGNTSLEIKGLVCGSKQWSGNTFKMIGTDSYTTTSLIYLPGATKTQADYPSDYNDNIKLILNEGDTTSVVGITNQSGAVVTLAGVISGSDPCILNLYPIDPIFLAGKNTFTSNSSILGGTIQFNNPSSFGQSSQITIDGFTTLQAMASTTLGKPPTGSNPQTFTIYDYPLTLDANGYDVTINPYITTTSSNDFTVGLNIIDSTGTGGIITLAANNAKPPFYPTYPANIPYVLQTTGTLQISSPSNIGGTVVGNGGTLIFADSFTLTNPWTFTRIESPSVMLNVLTGQSVTLNGSWTSTDPSTVVIIDANGAGTLNLDPILTSSFVIQNTGTGTVNFNATTTPPGAFSSTETTTLGSQSYSVDLVAKNGIIGGIGTARSLRAGGGGGGTGGAGIHPGIGGGGGGGGGGGRRVLGNSTDPIGILTITDSAELKEGSFLFIHINGTKSSRLVVEGSAQLDLTSTVAAIPNQITTTSSYVILDAATLVGRFSKSILIPDVSFLDSSLDYSIANKVSLNIAPITFSQSTILGNNALAVASALDEVILYNRENVSFDVSCCPLSVIATTPPVLEDVLISLRPLVGTDEMSTALNQLQSAFFKGLTIVQESNIVQVEKSLRGRLSYILDTTSCYALGKDKSTSCCDATKKTWDVWASGIGDVLAQKSNHYRGSPQVGYQSKMGGVVAGADAHFANYFYLGAMGGYTSSFVTFKERQGNANIQTGYVGLYLSAISDIFYGNLSVIGGFNDFSGRRYIDYSGIHKKASHSNTGKQLLSHADTGINIDVMGWFKLRPFDAFDYIAQTENGYTEKGAGQWDLHVGKKNAIMLRNELGLELSSCLCFSNMKWTVSPKASWVREVRVKGGRYSESFAKAEDALQAAFTVSGYFPNRSLFSPGVSLTGSLCKDKVTVQLYYDGEFTHGYSNNTYGGQIRCSF